MPDSFSRRRFVTLTAASVAVAVGAPIDRLLADTLRHREARDLDVSDRAPAGRVVLFQGDSITDTGRSRTVTAANAAVALGNGYPLLIASSVLQQHPGDGWQFYNRGVSGHKVPDLDARWDADTIALKPDIVSVLVGVNDYWHTKTKTYAGTTAEYEQQFGALLARTRAALPSVTLVVLEPFVLRIGAVDASWFPAFDERRAAAARVAVKARATWVPLQQPFDKAAEKTGAAYWAADGVHPTAAGHALIAERWRSATHV